MTFGKVIGSLFVSLLAGLWGVNNYPSWLIFGLAAFAALAMLGTLIPLFFFQLHGRWPTLEPSDDTEDTERKHDSIREREHLPIKLNPFFKTSAAGILPSPSQV